MKYQSVPEAFACPLELVEWLDKEAKIRGLSRSRLITTILLEASGLDIDLREPGRPRRDGR